MPRRTVFVEPFPSGHRFQWVEWVARSAHERGDRLTLLTSAGGATSEQFENFLGDLPMEVGEPFDGPYPSTEDIARALLDEHRRQPIDTYLILEADQPLKRWWRCCPPELRSRRGGPEGILMMLRYPPRLLWTDPKLLVLRLVKTLLSALTLVTGRASRVLFLVGREDLRPGGLLKKVRDPAICTSHSRDRAAIRARVGLPADRYLAAIHGSISAARKNVPLVFEAVLQAGDDVDLLLAGSLWEDARDWLATVGADEGTRIHRRIGFLSDEELDAYVAAADLCVVALSNPGPSGIMGKALAAGVPVLTSGSANRRREVLDLGYGIDTELSAEAISAGIRSLRLEGRAPVLSAFLPDGHDFGDAVLGIRPNGTPRPAGLHVTEAR
jgi:glycosyltransferase involved in cell wall biosynthesis